jgi:hypothetical protein
MSVAAVPVDIAFTKKLPKIEVPTSLISKPAGTLGLPFAALLTPPDSAPCAFDRQHQSGLSARHLGHQESARRCLGIGRPPERNTLKKSRL